MFNSKCCMEIYANFTVMKYFDIKMSEIKKMYTIYFTTGLSRRYQCIKSLFFN